ncbi:hypothetical protein DPMN_098920 [Dreissena polymorpha]|uniref:Uncharacterized protein n=1 Tax=Dreissena polymorpha TaxID=45954 RepID=A0A9D4R645_DREPO|nr:hypothetical protein DPMN_098920 [Dreissena polymorpha]
MATVFVVVFPNCMVVKLVSSPMDASRTRSEEEGIEIKKEVMKLLGPGRRNDQPNIMIRGLRRSAYLVKSAVDVELQLQRSRKILKTEAPLEQEVPRKLKAYLKRSRVRFLGLKPVLGVFGGYLKNARTVGIDPVTSRSLGGHHIHYATATVCLPVAHLHNRRCSFMKFVRRAEGKELLPNYGFWSNLPGYIKVRNLEQYHPRFGKTGLNAYA